MFIFRLFLTICRKHKTNLQKNCSKFRNNWKYLKIYRIILLKNTAKIKIKLFQNTRYIRKNTYKINVFTYKYVNYQIIRQFSKFFIFTTSNVCSIMSMDKKRHRLLHFFIERTCRYGTFYESADWII